MFDITKAVLSDENIRYMIDAVTDNEGETCARYSVFFYDGSVLCMSDNPGYARGVSMWGEGGPNDLTDNFISFENLPEHVQRHVYGRVREGYRDFIEERHNEGLMISSIQRNIMDEDFDESGELTFE